LADCYNKTAGKVTGFGQKGASAAEYTNITARFFEKGHNE